MNEYTYSDANLAYKTFTFSLGESLLLAGCRVCQGKDETEIYTLRNKSCQQCLVNSEIISEKVVEITDSCGLSYNILNKIYGLEKKDTCENEPLSLSLHLNSTTNTNSIVLENEKCDLSNFICCVENKNKRNLLNFKPGVSVRCEIFLRSLV